MLCFLLPEAVLVKGEEDGGRCDGVVAIRVAHPTSALQKCPMYALQTFRSEHVYDVLAHEQLADAYFSHPSHPSMRDSTGAACRPLPEGSTCSRFCNNVPPIVLESAILAE